MISLALRLAVFGGRDQTIRQIVTVAATGAAVALLLVIAAFGPALEARTSREAQRGRLAPREAWEKGRFEKLEPGSVLITESRMLVGGQTVSVVAVGGVKGAAPVPPGLSRIPSPGEVFLAPGLEDLAPADPVLRHLESLGTIIAEETVAPPALLYPDELVAYVGWDPESLARVPSAEVRKFPLDAPSITLQSKTPVRLGMMMGLVGLFVPIALFVGVVARLGAAQREHRLATLRLAGATPRQVLWIIAVEGALTGTAASVLGVLAFFGARSLAASIAVGGMEWFPNDFRPAILPAALVVTAVPLACALGAALSMRRLDVSPLQVARRGRARPLHRMRLGVAAAGVAGLGAASFAGPALAPSSLLVLAGVSILCVALGLPILGPWVTERVGTFVAERTGHGPVLLAARRLQAQPGAAFRPSTGVVVAVFFASAFYAYAAGNLGTPPTAQLPGSASMRVDTHGFGPPAVSSAARALGRLPDVRAVTIRRAHARGVSVAVASCADLRDLRVIAPTPCESGVLIPPGTPERFGAAEEQELLPARRAASGVTVSVGAAERVRPRGVDVLGGPVVDPSLLPAGFTRTLEADQILVLAPEEAGTAVAAAVGSTLPGAELESYASERARYRQPIEEVERAINLLVTLILAVAITGLAVTVATGVLERRQTFTLLRAGGVALRDVLETAALEAVIPFALAVVAGTALGVMAAASFTTAVGATMSVPWIEMGAIVGVAAAATLVLVAATSPLIARATSIQNLQQG